MTALEFYAALMQRDQLELDLRSLRPAWMFGAACRDHPEINFHPERGEDTRPAKAVCAGCSVRGECLAFALQHEMACHGHGIWGGLSARERRKLNRARVEHAA